MGSQGKLEIKLDENNTYLVGKYGPVIKCVEEIDGKEKIQFKPIKKDVDISKLEKGEYDVKEVIDTKKTEAKKTRSKKFSAKN